MESFEVAYRVSQHDTGSMSLSIALLSAVYAQAGRQADALSLQLEAEQKDTFASAFIRTHHYVALARSHLAMGALPLALAAIGRAEKLAEETQSLGLLADAIRVRANIAIRDPAATVGEVCTLYQRAIDIARPCGMRPLIAQCLAGMAQAHEAAGDVAAAADYDNQARQLFDELGLPPDSPVRRQ